jgi:hypothetical protein
VQVADGPVEREPGSQAKRRRAEIAASVLKSGSNRGLPGGSNIEIRFISDLLAASSIRL